MEKKGIPVWMRVVLLLFLLYAVITLVSLGSQILEKRQQLQVLDMRVEEYTATNEELKEEIASGFSNEDISEIARTELGYAEPGERVFVDTSNE